MCAFWRDRHCLPTRTDGTGGNIGARYVCMIWRDRQRLLPASGLPTTAPTLDMHSQSGGIDLVSQPSSTSAKPILRDVLSGTSQSAPVVEETNLNQNTIVNVKPHKGVVQLMVGGWVASLSQFWEGTARKPPLPGTDLANPGDVR